METDRTTLLDWETGEAPRLLDIHRRPEVVRWFDPPEVMTTLAGKGAYS